MNKTTDPLAITLFSEIFMADQLARNKISKILPKGMELSHFSVLNYLAQVNAPRTPAQLAKTFNLTKGAMTNTLGKLEWAGHVHIHPDWDDARRKQVVISPSGRRAQENALEAIAPLFDQVVDKVGSEQVRSVLPVLRSLRGLLSESD